MDVREGDYDLRTRSTPVYCTNPTHLRWDITDAEWEMHAGLRLQSHYSMSKACFDYVWHGMTLRVNKRMAYLHMKGTR